MVGTQDTLGVRKHPAVLVLGMVLVTMEILLKEAVHLAVLVHLVLGVVIITPQTLMMGLLQTRHQVTLVTMSMTQDMTSPVLPQLMVG
jgi:hypothetical protein